MKKVRGLLAACAVCCLFVQPTTAQPVVTTADFDPLVAELQAFVETANLQRFLALLAPDADEAEARDFASRALQDEVTHAVVLARFVTPAEDFPDGSRYHLTVETFTESGNRARLQTWQLDVVPAPAADAAAGRWHIAGHQRPDTIDGLHHLELNPERQFNAAGFALSAEDMELRLSRGTAFVSEIDSGVTGLLLIGDGTLTFSPAPAAERRQIEIFAGGEVLEAEFTHAFVRINPLALAALPTAALEPAPVDEGTFEEARELFDELARLTFVVDFSEFSDRTWWLAPRPGNLVAEIHTEEYGDLTYTQTETRPEDVSLYLARSGARDRALCVGPQAGGAGPLLRHAGQCAVRPARLQHRRLVRAARGWPRIAGRAAHAAGLLDRRRGAAGDPGARAAQDGDPATRRGVDDPLGDVERAGRVAVLPHERTGRRDHQPAGGGPGGGRSSPSSSATPACWRPTNWRRTGLAGGGFWKPAPRQPTASRSGATCTPTRATGIRSRWTRTTPPPR